MSPLERMTHAIMDALLGKITHINRPSETTDTPSGTSSLEVKFKPACLFPARTRVPEWLKDQTLTIHRDAPDPRENPLSPGLRVGGSATQDEHRSNQTCRSLPAQYGSRRRRL